MAHPMVSDRCLCLTDIILVFLSPVPWYFIVPSCRMEVLSYYFQMVGTLHGHNQGCSNCCNDYVINDYKFSYTVICNCNFTTTDIVCNAD